MTINELLTPNEAFITILHSRFGDPKAIKARDYLIALEHLGERIKQFGDYATNELIEEFIEELDTKILTGPLPLFEGQDYAANRYR